MVPIYEQIVDQIKTLIRNGELKENDNLPSVRTLSKELKISALTVKKAYDNLESEGFTVTVHGKGTYVAATNTELLLEEQKKELEADLEQAIQKGRRCGISDEDIKSLRKDLDLLKTNLNDFKEKTFEAVNDVEKYQNKKYDDLFRILSGNNLIKSNFRYNNKINSESNDNLELNERNNNNIVIQEQNYNIGLSRDN